MRNVEIRAGVATDFHFVVNGASDNVAWSQLGAGVIALHERLAGAIEQARAFAAHGFADKERLGGGMIEAGGVELHEFHVANFQPGAPRHGNAVASGDVRIAGIEIHLPGAARRQDGVRRTHGKDFIVFTVEEICTDAGIIAGHLQPTGGNEVNGHVVFQNLHGTLLAHLFHQDADNFRAGHVAAVENPAHGVAALAPQIIIGIRFAGVTSFAFEAHAPAFQRGNAGGTGGNDLAGHLGVGQPRAGHQGVLQVGFDGVSFGHRHRNAALRAR